MNEKFKNGTKTEKAIKLLEDQIKDRRRAMTNRFNIKQQMIDNGIQSKTKVKDQIVSNDKIFDLRNLPGGINFRSVKNSFGENEFNFNCSPSRSFYLNDYKFADSLTLNNDINENGQKVQPIILNEFQPYDMLTPADLLDGIGDIAIKAANTTVGMLAKPAVRIAGNLISKTLINSYSENTSEIYKSIRERKYFSSDPVQVVQNMFNGGRWLNTYELPYFGGNYLKAEYSNKWSQTGAKGFLGALAGDNENIGLKMLGMDFPSNPKFQTEGMDSTRDPINIEFYLLNVNDVWLEKNFQFLNAIYAGANWLHMKYCVIRPPNVYHVICPGRFQIYWAAIDVTVTFEGKLRRNERVSQKLRAFSKAIDDGMLWPDAWKIKINIKDLTPNNFNMYAEYYMNGFKAEELASLEEQIGLADAVGSLVDYFNEVMSDNKKSFNEALEESKKQKAQLDKVKDAFMNNIGGERKEAQEQKLIHEDKTNRENKASEQTERLEEQSKEHMEAVAQSVKDQTGMSEEEFNRQAENRMNRADVMRRVLEQAKHNEELLKSERSRYR